MKQKLDIVLAVLRKKSPSAILVKVVKLIAEGGAGPTAQKVYWMLVGLKVWITLALVLATTILDTLVSNGMCMQCAQWSSILWTIAGILFAVGLYDGAVRADAPKPVDIERK